MQEITLQPRSCECCGGDDLEPVWSSQSLVKRVTDVWRFPVNVVICRICSFCFASPGPKHDDLARYYAEGLSGYKEIGLPYSIDARLSVLERYRVTDGVFVEIGGDQPGEFHRRCAPYFGKLLVVEVSDDTHAELRRVHDLADNSVDVLVHYDVLEHIAEVRDFLVECHRALKPGGVMICEVPDIRLYPRNLLLLECEHVNHFSAVTLTAIARMAGLNLIELSHNCSRPYGFLSVFRKEEVRATTGFDSQCEYIDALACVQGGIEQIRRNEEKILTQQQRITLLGSRQKKVTLWAVTELLRRLLDNYKLPDSVIVVDSDPRRVNHLEQEGIVVLQPKDCVDHIARSELLVICAPRYTPEILDWVLRQTGKSFAGDTLTVIGAGPSGETLI